LRAWAPRAPGTRSTMGLLVLSLLVWIAAIMIVAMAISDFV
jgi:hypothetical protein